MFRLKQLRTLFHGSTSSHAVGIETGIQAGGLGQAGYGLPRDVYAQGRGMPVNPRGAGYGTGATSTMLNVPPWPLEVVTTSNPASYGPRPVTRPNDVLAVGTRNRQKRTKRPENMTWPGGVQATSPASEALGYYQPPAMVPPPYGTVLANPVSPLFGRPGFTYVTAAPSARLGPNLKGSPGTGATGPQDARSRGFAPAAYTPQQIVGGVPYDYAPVTASSYDLGEPASQAAIPRNIGVATDGRELVGTYTPHDFTPADRFFKQGRSVANWQNMTFGPDYRYLLAHQQVAKYNLRSSIVPSRQLSPQNYFLGYQTSPATAALIGSQGQGNPLGYGSQ